jgi:HD superfamily phosphohydrolase YqeK
VTGRAADSPRPPPDVASAPRPTGARVITLPPWAVVSDGRRSHIARVVEVIAIWAAALALPAVERAAWEDAARWHDALRDAPEAMLRAILGDDARDAGLDAAILHGPAAAARLVADGERRADVLDAVRWHTIGSVTWDRTGQALYMADFLEPGRTFARAERAALAERVPRDFEGAFRDVVQMRVRWAVNAGKPLAPQTVALWNAAR